MSSAHSGRNPVRISLLVILLTILPACAWAQTKVKPPRNFFSVEDDVRAGREAARELSGELKLLIDGEAERQLARVGARLVAAIPEEYRREQFVYTFRAVDDDEQNAFALPGGLIYVNRGMMRFAHTEGELAGVLAHEISHVALRHGTAQASRAVFAEIGIAVLAELLGDGKKAQVAQVGAFVGSTLMLLKYSRNYETQADLLGAQIMARAGYDPEDMSRLFRRMEGDGGNKGLPRWLSSHPKMRDRAERIGREAAMLDRGMRRIPDVADLAPLQQKSSRQQANRGR